jgi:hypothetical protein
MPTFPAPADLTGSSITEAQFKTALENLLGAVAQAGTGVSQAGNVIKIGWDSSLGRLRLTTDSTDRGALAHFDPATGQLTLLNNTPTAAGHAASKAYVDALLGLGGNPGLASAYVRFSGFTTANKTGAYDRVSNVVSVQVTGHGMRVGDKIYLDFTTGSSGIPTDGLYDVASVVGADEFTINLVGANTSGNVTMVLYAIQKEVNIETVTKDGRGIATSFWCNFTAPRPDAEYVVTATGQAYPGSWNSNVAENSTAGVSYNTANGFSLYSDQATRRINVTVHG